MSGVNGRKRGDHYRDKKAEILEFPSFPFIGFLGQGGSESISGHVRILVVAIEWLVKGRRGDLVELTADFICLASTPGWSVHLRLHVQWWL